MADPDDPSAGLQVLRSLDTTTIFTPFAFPGYPASVKLIGMNLTYDGHLVIGAFGQICVVDREFARPAAVHDFAQGNLLTNSFAVDDAGGIYVATGSLAPQGTWTYAQAGVDGQPDQRQRRATELGCASTRAATGHGP